jgi:hypothetical protein
MDTSNDWYDVMNMDIHSSNETSSGTNSMDEKERLADSILEMDIGSCCWYRLKWYTSSPYNYNIFRCVSLVTYSVILQNLKCQMYLKELSI